MPARVILVHDDPDFVRLLAHAIRAAGVDVEVFSDPLGALDVLDAAQTVDLLITCVQFPEGKPNGIALARMARLRHHKIKILFVAEPEFEEYNEDLGTFLPVPTTTDDVVATVRHVLDLA